MICSSCKNEFNNIEGLKFCPYCGTKLEVTSSEQAKDGDEDNVTRKMEGIKQEGSSSNKLNDTLEMPVITKETIKEYNREKSSRSVRKPFKYTKAVISAATIIVLIVLGAVGYFFLSNRTVDEARIKQDLVGKVITLPKGTKVEIKKGYIKSLSISSRNTDKSAGKDDIKADVTINNDLLEAKTVLGIHYVEDKNMWKMTDKVEISGDTTIKPVADMDEKQFLEAMKQQSIAIGNTNKALGDADVKELKLVQKTPDYDNLKEQFLVEASIDNGVAAASGKLKCTLNFQNESWSIVKVERNDPNDFRLALSPDFSQDKIVEAIKDAGMEETVSNANLFGGKGFFVRDSFTKAINISSKNFDDQSGVLAVTAKRDNSAGELKTVLSTDYSFNLSLSKLELVKKSKTTVDSAAVNDIASDFIISSITNVEIEGGDVFFWFSDNHKITADEAKTFKLTKVLSKKGLQNVKYVYGSVTYSDSGKKTKSVVAIYYLVYDSSKGYNWKLDKIVGEDSPDYKQYVPEPH